jgi:ketosteroid isomerase-like protein
MSENLDLVRSIYAEWERGDFHAVSWADPQIELVRPSSVDGDALKGQDSSAAGWREWLSAWSGFKAEAYEYRVLDKERVLVFGRMSGRGRLSDVVTDTATVIVFHVHDGKVTRLVLYSDRDRALADLGLAE